MRKFNVAIVGASGLVGRTMLKVLEERNFPVGDIVLLASEKSAGKTLKYLNKPYKINKLSSDSFENIDIALFSAGGKISGEYAPIAAAAGAIVIDNSSKWRMEPEIPLVVPEVNPDKLLNHKGIIANPNCSTIQLLVALKPIDDNFSLKRVIVSTYQSISGAGQKGLDQLKSELSGQYGKNRPIAFNTLFHPFEENGFTIEENKMINETRKILDKKDLSLAMTCVRLPIIGGHAESVNFETYKPFNISDIRDILASSDGIILKDNIEKEEYPHIKTSENTDPVYIGRIRMDHSAPNSAYMWVVADNLRKGAATNAVQIAEKLIELKLIK